MRRDALSPQFFAVVHITEQVVLDSLCAAEATTGMGRTVRALPLAQLLELLTRVGRLRP